jgi:hypothetical protein
MATKVVQAGFGGLGAIRQWLKRRHRAIVRQERKHPSQGTSARLRRDKARLLASAQRQAKRLGGKVVRGKGGELSIGMSMDIGEIKTPKAGTVSRGKRGTISRAKGKAVTLPRKMRARGRAASKMASARLLAASLGGKVVTGKGGKKSIHADLGTIEAGPEKKAKGKPERLPLLQDGKGRSRTRGRTKPLDRRYYGKGKDPDLRPRGQIGPRDRHYYGKGK